MADKGFDPVHALSIIEEEGGAAVKLLGTVEPEHLTEEAAVDEGETFVGATAVGFPELSDCLNTYDFQVRPPGGRAGGRAAGRAGGCALTRYSFAAVARGDTRR
eukprot:SAG11_NODE_7368_length_1155_cov_1.358902_2_plen_104_part_00